MSQNTVRIIDLFAGLGGIRLGFEQAMKEIGFETKCVFSSEIKKYAIKAYQGYFGNEMELSMRSMKIRRCRLIFFSIPMTEVKTY
ncbi:MAG: DNA cytosine methyltransferase [Schaedlerella sp.]|nr:DNA cytosine methyltransferase [Schaedlerella sp.]